MRLEDFDVEELLFNNFHILARKLFTFIDYKSENKYHYCKYKKVITGYKYVHEQGDFPYSVSNEPVYETVTEPISKYMYNKYKKNPVERVNEGIEVGYTVERVGVSYKDEYIRLRDSNRKTKDAELERLFGSYYALVDEYYNYLYQKRPFISDDYLERVRLDLLPAMHAFIERVLEGLNLDVE